MQRLLRTTTAGYTPEFPGIEQLQGRIVHPQNWPDDLDYAGKKVVVIGSGATAMTLVPAMAEDGAGARHHAAALADLRRRAAAKDPFANLLRRCLPPSSPTTHALEERAAGMYFY